ncbi:MAG TPA: S8 family serine peptidase [Candidatus Baltobacteraceae bacterium]|nr:S8 family serine peptidase [Candidatus Baltobacteraceae bacterium]
MNISRMLAGTLAALLATASAVPAAPRFQWFRQLPPTTAKPAIVKRLATHAGIVTVYANGIETLTDTKGKVRRRALVPLDTIESNSNDLATSQGEMLKPLVLSPRPSRPYAPNELIVVFSPGGAPAANVTKVSPQAVRLGQIQSLSNNYAANKVFAKIGADSLTRIASKVDRGTISRMRQSTGGALHVPALDLANAFVMHFTGAPLPKALEQLRKTSGIAYVSPNFYVSTMNVTPRELAPGLMAASRARAAVRATRSAVTRSTQGFAPHTIPTNYAISAGAQSMLDASSLNDVSGFDLIEQNFNQLPGQGERIANISIGDVNDATSAGDPCQIYAELFGPTVHTINGQHYIDWPSMPLIPTYVVDASGNASGTANACGADPSLGEVGLDFSMMAPLPHDLQRPGETGAGYTDLLGIAPGAQYSLYVPATTDGYVTMTQVAATMLAAATAPAGQRPDVITASLGFGFDAYGFPGRYLEDDPLIGSAISSIVNGQGIVVCVSANDGTRTYTPTAIGPSGGSAATNVIPNTATPTNVNDVMLSTIPSQDYDYGSIDVGGTTLNDTLAASPTDSANASVKSQLAWPEVRWTGFGDFSSGFGSRVNVSAPSDNVLAISHTFDGTSAYDYDHVDVGLSGGTSASAPEAAAAAAIMLQVGKLTGHPFASPLAVRQFLIQTGRPVPNVPQADEPINVGPQIDIGNAVSSLIAQNGKHIAMAVPRVSLTQRRSLNQNGTAFVTDTTPWQIDLQGRDGDDRAQFAPITISPDWEGLPADTKFALTLANKPSVVLATTPFARLLPADVLQAAGLPLVASGQRTVQLQYTASAGLRAVSTSFSLVFGAADATIDGGAPPHVAPVTTGTTMSVSYDISRSRNVQNPQLVITEPGRVLPSTSIRSLFHFSYTVPLTQLQGTVQVPVSALQGAGVYGVGVQYGATPLYGGGSRPKYTEFAYTRVEAGSPTKANPVTLSTDGVNYNHFSYVDAGGRYTVKWDVSNVSGANGALIEIGPSAPSLWGSYNTVNNPNGSIQDNNGYDSPSVYTQAVSGATGTIALPASSTLTPTLYNQVRVIPMNGSTPAGEASDTSMIGLNGFMPPDGNPIAAFTAGNGGTGEVTTLVTSGGTVWANGVFPFDTKTGVMGPDAGESFLPYGLDFPYGTVSASNYQVFEQYSLPSLVSSQIQSAGFPKIGVLQPASTPAFNFWTSLPNGEQVYGVAYARQTDTSLIALYNSSTGAYTLTTMQLPNTAFGTQYTATTAFTSSTVPAFGTSPLSFDPQLNLGIVEGGSAAYLDSCSSASSTHTISTVSMTSGAIQQYPGAGHGLDTTSYDSVHHVLASADLCGNLTFYDMVAHTSRTIALPIGYWPDMLSVDAKNGLVLVGDALDPDFLTNNDVQSAIFVYDEQGNLQKTLHNMNFRGGLGFPYYLELDENTRELLVPDYTATQIEAVNY